MTVGARLKAVVDTADDLVILRAAWRPVGARPSHDGLCEGLANAVAQRHQSTNLDIFASNSERPRSHGALTVGASRFTRQWGPCSIAPAKPTPAS